MSVCEKNGHPISDEKTNLSKQFEPVVLSLSFDYLMRRLGSPDEVASGVDSALEKFAVKIKDNKAFIGHIKAFISFSTGIYLGFSLVRDKSIRQKNVFLSGDPVNAFTIAVTAIVYGCSENALHLWLEESLASGLPEDIYSRPEQFFRLKMFPSA